MLFTHRKREGWRLNCTNLLPAIVVHAVCSNPVITTGYDEVHYTVPVVDKTGPITIASAIIFGATTFILESSIFVMVAMYGLYTC